MSTSSSSSALAAVARLTPQLGCLLRLKALMGGLCNGLTYRVLTELTPPPTGQKWNKTAFLAAEQSLLHLKLLERTSGRCVPKLEHRLAVEAAAMPGFVEALSSAIRSADTIAPPSLMELELRLALYTGNEANFAQTLRRAQLYAGNPFARKGEASHPFASQGLLLPAEAASWYASRPLIIRLALLENHLALLLSVDKVTPLLPVMLPDLVRMGEVYTSETMPYTLALTHVLRGGIDDLRPMLENWMALANNPFGHLLAGIDTLLRGEVEKALPLLLEARKRWGKLVGKRNPLLPEPGGLCLAMAVLAENNPAREKELSQMLDLALSAWGPPALRGGWRAALALQYWNRGQEKEARQTLNAALNAPPPGLIDRSVVAVADVLINGKAAQARTAAVNEIFTRLAPLLPLAGRGLAEFLAFVDRESLAAHQHLEAIPVTAGWLELFTPRPVWERVFDSVTQALCPDAPESPAKGKAASANASRLVWCLHMDDGIVTPMEQKSKGTGWTAGRSISLKRLSEERGTLAWLTEQDQRVINTITWLHSWHGITCEINADKALPELVGHPLLLDRDTRKPLTLRQRDVTLSVREEARGGYTISLNRPDSTTGRSFSSGDCEVVQEEEDVWCLYKTAPRLLKLAEHIGRDGLYVPPAGTARVLRLLRDMDPSVPVQASVNAVQDLPGSARPVVQLRPLRGGLHVSLGVRPFAQLADGWLDSPFFPTAHGTPRPFADHQGRVYRVVRNFDEERAAARHLVEACPTLRDLGDEAPWEIPELDDALTFLLELRELAEADPGTALLCEWPEGETLRVEPHATAASLSVQVRHHREWFQVRGELQVREGLVLDMGRLLERLEQARGRFVPLGDGAFLALTQQFKRQLQRLAALSEAEKDGSRKVHPLGAAAVEAALDGVRTLSVDAAWSALMERIRAAEAHCPRLPSTLRAELRDYQVDGFAWLSRLAHWGAGACLADDMGLGKTVQTIAALLEQAPHGPALIVAPTSVCHNWTSELHRFAPTLHPHRITTGKDRSSQVKALGQHDVLIISYGLLHTMAPVLASRVWRTVVFDEAQALKNAATKRAKASKVLSAHFRVALTGTPIENYLEDVWSLFHTINPGLLGPLKNFQQRFASGSSEARQALRALLRPFLLRRTKSAVLTELPPRTEQVLRVDLPADERAFYEALRRKALERLEQPSEEGAGQRKLSILAELTRLRRASCHPALIDPETPLPGAKLAAFIELVDNLLKGNHKALVFSQFVGHLALVRKALDERRIRYQYLDGATPEKDRRDRVRDFQDGEGDIFLISLKAGGQGLNLTAADYVIHLDPWWNPAVEDQASDRAHRIGQERPVTVYRLVVADSVEEKILALHASKRSLAADVLDGTDTPLSEAELLALLRDEGEKTGDMDA